MPENFVKINEKLENPKVKELFASRADISDDDQEAINALLNKIVVELITNAAFLTPVKFSKAPVKNEDGSLSLAKNTDVSFMLLSNGDKRYLPLFTDSESLEDWDGEMPDTVQINFDNCAAMLESNSDCDGIAVNPFTDNMLVPRSTALKWSEQKQINSRGHAEHVITKDTPVSVYTPNPYPMQLSNKLCEVAKSEPAVKAIWLRGITLNDDEGYLLIVDHNGDRKKLFAAFGDCARPFLGKDKALHIVALDEGFGGQAAEKVLPIYSKE